jgi:hypothetical protein
MIPVRKHFDDLAGVLGTPITEDHDQLVAVSTLIGRPVNMVEKTLWIRELFQFSLITEGTNEKIF